MEIILYTEILQENIKWNSLQKIEIDDKMSKIIKKKIPREDVSKWTLYCIEKVESIEITDLNT